MSNMSPTSVYLVVGRKLDCAGWLDAALHSKSFSEKRGERGRFSLFFTTGLQGPIGGFLIFHLFYFLLGGQRFQAIMTTADRTHFSLNDSNLELYPPSFSSKLVNSTTIK